MKFRDKGLSTLFSTFRFPILFTLYSLVFNYTSYLYTPFSDVTASRLLEGAAFVAVLRNSLADFQFSLIAAHPFVVSTLSLGIGQPGLCLLVSTCWPQYIGATKAKSCHLLDESLTQMYFRANMSLSFALFRLLVGTSLVHLV